MPRSCNGMSEGPRESGGKLQVTLGQAAIHRGNGVVPIISKGTLPSFFYKGKGERPPFRRQILLQIALLNDGN